MIHSRRAALALAAAWGVAWSRSEDARASAEPRWCGLPPDLDPLDRPVLIRSPSEGLRRVGSLISERIGLPVEFDGPSLQNIGVTASYAVRLSPGATPAGWLLWRCVLSCPAPPLIFVLHRGAAGGTQRIVFTSTHAAAEMRKAVLPYDRKFVGGVLPFLEHPDSTAADRAAQALGRFGAEAEDAVPHLQRYLARTDLPETYHARGRDALEAVRSAVRRRRNAAPLRSAAG